MSFTSEGDLINSDLDYAVIVYDGISTWLKSHKKRIKDETNSIHVGLNEMPFLYNCPFDNFTSMRTNSMNLCYQMVMTNLFENGQLSGERILILNDSDQYLSMGCYHKKTYDIDLDRGLSVWNFEWKRNECEGKYCHEKFVYSSIVNESISQTELIFSSFGIKSKDDLEVHYKHYVDFIRECSPYLVIGCGTYHDPQLSYNEGMDIDRRFMSGLHASSRFEHFSGKTLFLSFNRGYR